MTPNHTSESIALASRLAGAVWGHLVGDAVGVPYEFGPARPADSVVFGATGAHHQPPGTWSDDGALMLALLDSLTGGGSALEEHFDPEDQGARALAWYRNGAYAPGGRVFDIGTTTHAALTAIGSGMLAVDAGPTGDHSGGNGSLMRILPLALVGREWSPALLITRSHLASRVTHGHPRCQVACALYCVAVAGLLAGMAPAAALEWALVENERVYREERGHEAHLAALEELRTWPDRGGSGFVVDAFWSAWDAFAGATDYADAIRRAVAYGADTDTTAAIAGGLAGAYWGWEGIPLEWRRGMRGRDIAQPLVDQLVGSIADPQRVRTSTASPLRVDELELRGTSLEGSGRVGITFLPGKKTDGLTGPHWRDLDLDLEQLRSLGVDTLFLLVEDSELDDCLVPELPDVMAADGPELVRFPIRDPRTPTDGIAYRAAVLDLLDGIRGGQFVAIACRGGIDRSGMTAACLYRELGFDFEVAIRRTQAARKGSITIHEQQELVRAWPPQPGRSA
jgi:ADP-ribosylglycohydrolase